MTEPTFENALGASDVVRAEEPPEPAPRSEGSTPKEEEEEEEEEPVFETRVSETRAITKRSFSETHGDASEPADAFAFDAPRRVGRVPKSTRRRRSRAEDDSPEDDVDRYDTDAGYGTALDTQSGFAASLEVPAKGIDDIDGIDAGDAGDDTAQETRGGGVRARDHARSIPDARRGSRSSALRCSP